MGRPGEGKSRKCVDKIRGGGSVGPVATTPKERQQRATTAFGWLAGGSLGLLVNYGIFLLMGPDWPVVPTTFALFVAGCFGGMWLSDRLGDRGFRVLGITAGVLVATALTLAVAVLMSTP
ncbi:MAG: hypothetical protein DRJ42_19205 [Deltaproteobacteria bacterium]|nr:MAG: hypothetical protein DRJ42_19205 [Deltaproteobacteria bacterium]